MTVSLTKSLAAHAGTFVTARPAKARIRARRTLGALKHNDPHMFAYAVRMRDNADTRYARY